MEKTSEQTSEVFVSRGEGKTLGSQVFRGPEAFVHRTPNIYIYIYTNDNNDNNNDKYMSIQHVCIYIYIYIYIQLPYIKSIKMFTKHM